MCSFCLAGSATIRLRPTVERGARGMIKGKTCLVTRCTAEVNVMCVREKERERGERERERVGNVSPSNLQTTSYPLWSEGTPM